jgi:sphingomyelin phosphodiesterase
MIIKIWSIAFITFTKTPVHNRQNEDGIIESKWLEYDFSDIEKVREWASLSNQFIKKFENSETKDFLEFTRFNTVDLIAPIFSNSSSNSNSNCRACDIAMRNAHRMARAPFSRRLLLKSLITGCKRKGLPDSECKGIVSAYGPAYLDVFREMDFSKAYMGQLACFHLLRACPHPELPDSEWNLPAPKKTFASQPSGKELKILHLSDLHYDSNYAEGSETSCRRTICCQNDSTTDEDESYVIKKPASKWGEYKCDMPLATLESMLQHISEMNKKENFDMVFFTGDIPSHDIFRESSKHSKAVEHASYKLLEKYINLNTTKIYPAVGNHEPIPSHLFPMLGSGKEKGYDLYNFIASEWINWLPGNSLSTFKKSGYYSIQHNDNLKIIVLNNNLCYSYNIWILLDPENPDPNGMFSWTIEELKEAERTGSKVYITSHVPPAGADCHQKFSRSWNKIVKAYSHIIIAQFYGHTHRDEFELYYLDGPKNAKNAISNSFIAPSITTYVNMNPGFRVYTVDAENYQVKDFNQYYANLNEKFSWKNGPVWKELYSAKKAYQVPSSTGPYINATFWHEVTELFDKSSLAFEKFNSYRYKNTGLQSKCDDKCKLGVVCNLRASNSREVCDWKRPRFPDRD